MKQLLCLCLLMVSMLSIHAQYGCEERISQGSIAFSIISEPENQYSGIGVEIGEQGIVSPLSGFIGFSQVYGKAYKGIEDTVVASMYVKGVFRISDMYAPIKVGVMGGTTIREKDISYLIGLNFLWVPKDSFGLSLQPMYTAGYFRTQLNLHLLL